MLPKKVKKRASLLAITLLISVIGIFFILKSLNKNILYFKSPTDIKNNQNDKTFFIADRILAKHDENYMPPELKDMMKKNAK